MGKAIGNYIHLHQQNYLSMGTDRYQGPSNKEVTKKIFEKHQEFILAQASTFKTDNLDKISETYNKRNLDQYKELKKIFNGIGVSKDQQQQFAQALVERLVAKNTSQEIIDDIVANLKWDDSRQTIYYAGTKYNIANAENLKLAALGDVQSYRYINTIMTRAIKLQESIKNSKEINEEIKKESIKKINEAVIKPTQALENYRERSDAELEKLKEKRPGSHKYLGVVDKNIAQKFYKILLGEKQKLQGLANVNSNLQWHFSELLGNLIGESAVQTSYTAIMNALKQTISAGKNTSNRNIDGVYVSPHLREDIMKDMGVLIEQNGTYQDKSGIHASYTFKGLGNDRMQKADANFILDLMVPQDKVGISLKNTNLQDLINSQIDEQISKYINIQGDSSNLMLYLAGMHQTYQNDIANHYLNILVTHADKETNEFTEVREAGLQSLRFALLFSALTGANQLRTGGQARVLAVYDKAAYSEGIKRIKLFDIYSLIEDAADYGIQNVVKTSPVLDTLRIENKRSKKKKASTQENVDIRLSRVIAATRLKQIGVSIAKQYLLKEFNLV